MLGAKVCGRKGGTKRHMVAGGPMQRSRQAMQLMKQLFLLFCLVVMVGMVGESLSTGGGQGRVVAVAGNQPQRQGRWGGV